MVYNRQKKMKRTIFLSVIACIVSLLAFEGCKKEKQMYTITVASNISSCSVSGGGTFEDGTTTTITAIPADGYTFVKWNDEITTNPRTITVTGNAAYIAMFEETGNGGGNGGGSSSIPTPTGVTASIETENGTDYILIEWNSVSAAVQYKVYYSTSSSGSYEYLGYSTQNYGYIVATNTDNYFKVSAVDADGNEQAVLIDFGISKHYTHQGQATTTSPIAHSKGFAPLEQYREGGVQEFSPTSDVYSLGATLYYLLTAQIPPEATLLIEDPLERPAKISSDLWQVVSRAMESSRKRRYQTVDEMLNALRNVRMTFSSKVNHSLGQVEEETVISSDIGETTVFQKQENKPLKTIDPKNVLQIRTNEQDANLKEEKETTFKGLLWGIIFICAFLVFIFLIFSRKYTNTEQPTFKPEVQHKPVDRLVLAEDNRDSIISALINNMVEVTGGSYMMGETPEQGKTEQSEEWMRDKAHKESVSTFFINKFDIF